MRPVTLCLIAIISFFLLAANSCQSETERQQVEARNQNMDRANQMVKVPEISNFVVREGVAEYMRRMDEPNKLFYIYVLADTGNVLGYYVSRGAPINICTFLTPPDRRTRNHSSIRKAPAADGVYYGDAACNTEYFFDSETNTMVMIQGLKLFVSEQPLELDAEPIRVKTDGS